MSFFSFFKKPKLNDQEEALASYLQSLASKKPNDLQVYQVALTHQSYSDRYHHKYNNERLEFLGDAVLDLVVSEYLYESYPEKNEGDLTRLRSAIVNRKTLNTLAAKIQLNQFIKAEVDLDMPGISLPGNALEALLGAFYLDLGYQVSKHVILDSLVSRFLDLDQLQRDHENFKSTLLEWSQKNGKHAKFQIVKYQEEKGLFVAQVNVEGKVCGEGTGRSKKLAEQEAAFEALIKLGVKKSQS